MNSAQQASGARVIRGAAVSSAAVMVSRILGLVREQIFAFFFGASREYDAFLTAFRIPNLLRDLLAEGALSAAFVTTFVKEMRVGGKERAFYLANLVVNALSVVLLLLVLLGVYFADDLVAAIAVGFDPDKAALATTLTRAMFPYIFMVAIAAVAMGMLNAQEYFAVPQSASTFFNLGSIGVGLSCALWFSPHYMLGLWHHTHAAASPQDAGRAMMGMALGTLAGGFLQCAMQLPTLYSTGYRWRPIVNLHDSGFRSVLRLMGPAVVGAAAVQLNVFVNSNFASMLGDKPISWLNYSFRLMQFPIGVFGVAVMTAALPAMSRNISDSDHVAFGRTLTRSLELVLLLTLPSTAGLATLGEPIMRLIYEHGRFAPADTAATATALFAYSLGLPGYAAIKLVQPAYVAMGDAKTPMYTSLLAVFLNASLNFLFVKVYHVGYVGLALSTSIMATVNVAVLIGIMEHRRPTLERRRLVSQVLRIAVASLVMTGVTWQGYRILQAAGFAKGSSRALIELSILLPLAILVYGAAAKTFGVSALESAWSFVKRKRRPR